MEGYDLGADRVLAHSCGFELDYSVLVQGTSKGFCDPKRRAVSESKGLFGAGFYTASAFNAIRLIQDLVYRKLHGTNLLAFAAFNAFFLVNFELVLAAAKGPLNSAHGTEGAPCSRGNNYSKDDRGRCCQDAKGHKDHAHFVHNSLRLNYPEDHEPHESNENRNPEPHAS